MTKQEKDQNQLKKNLKWILEHFEQFCEQDTRLNYLKGLTVSCKVGNVCFHYGEDPVDVIFKEPKKKKKK